jgi:hypothetical protein
MVNFEYAFIGVSVALAFVLGWIIGFFCAAAGQTSIEKEREQ